MRWTNDVYISTPHRVVSRGAGERYSIAFFLDPHPLAKVEAIPSCVPAGSLPKYPPILTHDYLHHASRRLIRRPRDAILCDTDDCELRRYFGYG